MISVIKRMYNGFSRKNLEIYLGHSNIFGTSFFEFYE